MKILLKIVLVLFVISIFGFVLWGMTPQQPMTNVDQFLMSSDNVVVENGKWLVFLPAQLDWATGFIFYPGGHVNYKSYAPMAFKIAESGYTVVIVPMPLSLAVMNSNAARTVIAAYPDIKQWVIGGHSLGGAMAASYAYNNQDVISGLVLLASYPTASSDLSTAYMPILSMYGSQDGLVSDEEILKSRNLMPLSAKVLEIQGGNHAQMGYYGEQAGDRNAEITRESQQAAVIEAMIDFLEGIN